MRTDDTRDQAVERLLRRSIEAGSEAGVSAGCLDAETLSAWTDGALSGKALERVETHVAGCARCQSMAAVMIRTAPVAPVAAPWWQRMLRPAWVIPLTAGAAAVAIWAVVPTRPPVPFQTPPAAGEQAREARAEPGPAPAPPPSQPAPADQLEARAGSRTTPPAKKARRAGNEASQERAASAPAAPAPAATDRLADARPVPASPAPAPAAAAAPPPARPDAAAEEALRGRAQVGALMKADGFARDIASPNPSIRWRLGPRGAIERTEDGGTTWTSQPSGVTADLIAGFASSPSVCWVVGRSGTVLRSLDGRSWSTLTFPEAVDLIGVEAVDASTATVTTSDGRRFQTTDGGRTWR